MRGAVLRHHPTALARLPLLVAHAALCLAANRPGQHAPLNPDHPHSCAATTARRPITAASAAADCACSTQEMAPIERQPGEWESPITSQLITSAVGGGSWAQELPCAPLPSCLLCLQAAPG